MRLSQKPFGVVSGSLQLSFLLRGGEDGSSIPTARGRALKVGMTDFALCHETSGRATNVFGRAVAAADLI